MLAKSDCESQSLPATVVNYEAVTAFKSRLLEAAWNSFVAGVRADLRPAFEQFCSDHGHWLEDYALFRALKAKHNGADFREWPEDLVRRGPGALARARSELRSQVDQGRFAQFLLFRQAERLKDYAHARGLRLIGDLPFFVSADSSDVWSNPELFLLDEKNDGRVLLEWDYGDYEGRLTAEIHKERLGWQLFRDGCPGGETPGQVAKARIA